MITMEGEVKKFLPYIDDGATYGSVRTPAVTSQAWYYNPGDTASDAPKDVRPYSQTLPEFSPLSRLREIGSTGESWQPGTGYAVKTLSLLNTAADDVRIWNVTVNSTLGGFSGYTNAGVYPADELSKSITTDEHGKQVIEFKDKEGKLILKSTVYRSARSGHRIGT